MACCKSCIGMQGQLHTRTRCPGAALYPPRAMRVGVRWEAAACRLQMLSMCSDARCLLILPALCSCTKGTKLLNNAAAGCRETHWSGWRRHAQQLKCSTGRSGGAGRQQPSRRAHAACLVLRPGTSSATPLESQHQVAVVAKHKPLDTVLEPMIGAPPTFPRAPPSTTLCNSHMSRNRP